MSDEENHEEVTTKKKRKKDPQAEMSFLDHLEELRWHIIKSAIAVVLFAVIAFALAGAKILLSLRRCCPRQLVIIQLSGLHTTEVKKYLLCRHRLLYNVFFPAL